MKKENWGWLTYHSTDWVRDDGSKYYIVELVAEHKPHYFTKIELPFFTKHIGRALRWICRKPRTKEEILKLSYKLI